VLREIRAAIQALDKKIDANHQDVTERFKSLHQAINGESVLGRYAAAEVEERLTDIEKRLSVLEKRR
jgi:hypothetical protein